jgi:hypothetical protein
MGCGVLSLKQTPTTMGSFIFETGDFVAFWGKNGQRKSPRRLKSKKRIFRAIASLQTNPSP